MENLTEDEYAFLCLYHPKTALIWRETGAQPRNILARTWGLQAVPRELKVPWAHLQTRNQGIEQILQDQLADAERTSHDWCHRVLLAYRCLPPRAFPRLRVVHTNFTDRTLTIDADDGHRYQYYYHPPEIVTFGARVVRKSARLQCSQRFRSVLMPLTTTWLNEYWSLCLTTLEARLELQLLTLCGELLFDAW